MAAMGELDGNKCQIFRRKVGAVDQRKSSRTVGARVETTGPTDSAGIAHICNLFSVSFPEIADLGTNERSIEQSLRLTRSATL